MLKYLTNPKSMYLPNISHHHVYKSILYQAQEYKQSARWHEHIYGLNKIGLITVYRLTLTYLWSEQNKIINTVQADMNTSMVWTEKYN